MNYYMHKLLVVGVTLLVAPVLFPVEIVRVALRRRRLRRVHEQVIGEMRRRGHGEPRVWGEA